VPTSVASLVNTVSVSIYLPLEPYPSSLIIHALRLFCRCFPTEGSLYVRFRFNYLHLTLYSADGKQLIFIIVATILSITTPSFSRNRAFISPYPVFCLESVLMVITRCLPLSALTGRIFASAVPCWPIFLQMKAVVLSSVVW